MLCDNNHASLACREELGGGGVKSIEIVWVDVGIVPDVITPLRLIRLPVASVQLTG